MAHEKIRKVTAADQQREAERPQRDRGQDLPPPGSQNTEFGPAPENSPDVSGAQDEDAAHGAVERFLSVFAGREGIFMEQHGQKGYSPVRPERDLTPDDVRRHLRGEATYGVYVVRKDNSCNFVCFDLDADAPPAGADEEYLAKAKAGLFDLMCRLLDALADHAGVTESNLLLEDTGGRGYHVWLPFTEPVQARAARQFGHAILQRSGVGCELFPKQDTVSATGQGNGIKLPLGLHRKYGNWSILLRRQGSAFLPIDLPHERILAVDAISPSRIQQFVTDADAIPTADNALSAPALPVTSGASIPAAPPIATGVGRMLRACGALRQTVDAIAGGQAPHHHQLFALGSLLSHIANGEAELHRVLSPWTGYRQALTAGQYHDLRRRACAPVTCRWMMEHGLCREYCNEEIRDGVAQGHSPSPIKYAVWRSSGDVARLLMERDVTFEQVYARTNLRRAWLQTREHFQEEDVVADEHESEVMEEDLDALVECVRWELSHDRWQPAPYRIVEVPKAKTPEGFEYRRKVLMHPRDHAVAQALVNVVGPRFEAGFSSSSLGRRLELREGDGLSVFRPWQSDWHTNKARLLAFTYYAPEYNYVRADVSKFFDNIDHATLMGLLAERLSDEPRILEAFRRLLKAGYIEDTGNEHFHDAGAMGIPQGPSFSPFLANVYLDAVDKYMESRCVEYVRYVDDIALLARDRDEALELTGELRAQLSGLSLQLNEAKTTAPQSVREKGPLLDFLGEIKYGATGILSSPTAEEQYPLSLLEELLEDLTGVEEFDTQALDQMGRHLAGYLRARGRLLGGKADETALALAKRGIMDCAPKPKDLLTFVQLVLSRQGADVQDLQRELVEQSPHPYARMVLVQALVWDRETVATDVAEQLLGVLAESPDSYLVRGLAHTARLNRGFPLPTSFHNRLDQEGSEFSKARAVFCLKNVELRETLSLLPANLRSTSLHVAGAAARVALAAGDETMARDVVRAWQPREYIDTSLLPLSIRAAIMAADSGSAELLVKALGGERSVLARPLIRVVLSACPQVFDVKADGQNRFLALGQVQQTARDEAVAMALAIEMTEMATPERARFGMDGGDIAALQVELAKARPGCEGAPRFITDFEQHVLLQTAAGTARCYTAIRKDSQSRFIIEDVPIDVCYEATGLNCDNWASVIALAFDKGICHPADVWSEGERIYAAYAVPPEWTSIAEWLKSNPECSVETGLTIAEAALAKAFRMESQGLPAPVAHPHGMVMGPANEIRFVNLITAATAPRYISHDGVATEDQSATRTSLFTGLLLFECITGDSPLRERGRVTLDPDDDEPRLSDSPKLDVCPQHLWWIIDRLTRPRADQRYDDLKLFTEDYKRMIALARHCRFELPAAQPEIIYGLETADAGAWRVAREVAFRVREGQAPHRVALSVLHVTAQRLCRAAKGAARRGVGWRTPLIGGTSRIAGSWFSARRFHRSTEATLGFAQALNEWRTTLEGQTRWSLDSCEIPMIAYCGLRVEVLSVMRAAAHGWTSRATADTALGERLVRELTAGTRQHETRCRLGHPTHSHGRRPRSSGHVVLRSHHWQATADILSAVRTADSVEPVEDADLGALVLAAALIHDGMYVINDSGRTIARGVGPSISSRRVLRNWQAALEAVLQAEYDIDALMCQWGDPDLAAVALGDVLRAMSAVRTVLPARRRRTKIAERFKHVGESLRVRDGLWAEPIVVPAAQVLRFPVHHLESPVGERATVDMDLHDDQRTAITACLLPSCLRRVGEAPPWFSRCGRHVWTAIQDWRVLTGAAVLAAGGCAAAWLLGGWKPAVGGIITSLVASGIIAWLLLHRDDKRP